MLDAHPKMRAAGCGRGGPAEAVGSQGMRTRGRGRGGLVRFTAGAPGNAGCQGAGPVHYQ